ncbi:histone-lysine N-methyltransferase SETMAR [Trichonephila clavipes]|nr:histone-lysine N-methyltransferase SETMAR [Trichonephila clavipes]
MDALHTRVGSDATSPTYSPDMATSDYYQFSYLQLHLKGTIFHSNDEFINKVDGFQDPRLPQYFAEWIVKFSERWQIVIDLNRDYYPHYSFADFVCIYPFT